MADTTLFVKVEFARQRVFVHLCNPTRSYVTLNARGGMRAFVAVAVAQLSIGSSPFAIFVFRLCLSAMTFVRTANRIDYV